MSGIYHCTIVSGGNPHWVTAQNPLENGTDPRSVSGGTPHRIRACTLLNTGPTPPASHDDGPRDGERTPMRRSAEREDDQKRDAESVTSAKAQAFWKRACTASASAALP